MLPSRESEPLTTTRWRLDIRYDGTDFAGWATQRGQRTVQGELELWLARMVAPDPRPRLVCAGRTDAGVHARGQVAHLDLPADHLDEEAADRLRGRLRRALPPDVAVTAIARAPAGFDARFSAVWRRYVYRIADAVTVAEPLRRREVAALPHLRIDPARMAAAAPVLLGLRDFGAFCRRREGATTVRTLLELAARRSPDGPVEGLVELTVRADAFCHSMVRSLVGALVEVGSGRREVGWLSELTRRAERSGEARTMPAHGLTLEEVGYPPADRLAARAAGARSTRSLADA